MRSLNGEEMTGMLDSVTTSLLICHKITEPDLQSNPELREKFLNILTALITLDRTVIETKLKAFMSSDNEAVIKFIKRNNIELALIDGGLTKPALTVI